PLPLLDHIHLPNPFGLLRLKIASYSDEPVARIKDFADLVELLIGLVATGNHYQLDPHWLAMRHHSDAAIVLDVVRRIGGDDYGLWDLENLIQELGRRNGSFEAISRQIPRATQELLEILS